MGLKTHILQYLVFTSQTFPMLDRGYFWFLLCHFVSVLAIVFYTISLSYSHEGGGCKFRFGVEGVEVCVMW